MHPANKELSGVFGYQVVAWCMPLVPLQLLWLKTTIARSNNDCDIPMFVIEMIELVQREYFAGCCDGACGLHLAVYRLGMAALTNSWHYSPPLIQMAWDM